MNIEFNEQAIQAHNELRALHGNSPLKLASDLAEAAQKWADFLATKGALKHSPNNGDYGENIAMKMLRNSSVYTGKQASLQWYAEIEFYDFDNPDVQPRCGHFSQLVWKDTKEAGFGKAVGKDGKMFSVGQYRPPGNFAGEWKDNLPFPLDGTIEIPTQAEIMGAVEAVAAADKEKAAAQSAASKSGAPAPAQAPAGASVSAKTGPEPDDLADRLVKKATKKKTLNGEKKIIITGTYQRPDGFKYDKTFESVE